MSEKTESDKADDEEAEGLVDDTVEIDVEHLIDDLESSNKKDKPAAQPAWRRVEDYMDRKRDEQELDDLYDVDSD